MVAAPEVRLQAAERADLPILLPFIHAHLKLQGRPFNLVRVEQSIMPLLQGDVARRLWVIEARSSAAGYAATSLCHSIAAGGCTLLVDQLFIDPDVRGRGIARAALRLLVEQARQAGAVAMQLRAGSDIEGLRRLCGAVAAVNPAVTRLLELDLTEPPPRR